MADWMDMALNNRVHGHFAGRSTAEQDAYFAFFSGSEHGRMEQLRRIGSRVVAYAARPLVRRDLRPRAFRVASLR